MAGQHVAIGESGAYRAVSLNPVDPPSQLTPTLLSAGVYGYLLNRGQTWGGSGGPLTTV